MEEILKKYSNEAQAVSQTKIRGSLHSVHQSLSTRNIGQPHLDLNTRGWYESLMVNSKCRRIVSSCVGSFGLEEVDSTYYTEITPDLW